MESDVRLNFSLSRLCELGRLRDDRNQVPPIEDNEISYLRSQLLKVTAENARLDAEKESLLLNLEECKSELFKRVPATQISDETLEKEVELLHQSIDDFVFDIMKEEASDDTLYKMCQKQRHQRRKSRKRAPRNRFNDFIRRQDIRAWGQYHSSNLYILSVIIQWILDEFIFREGYPMSISEKQIQFMKDVEKGMRITGCERFDLWRSETLIALTAPQESRAYLEERAKRICDNVEFFLTPWLLDAGPLARVEGRFKREILYPAMVLHQNLNSSSHHYDVRYVRSFSGVSLKDMVRQWRLKDADVWQELRGEKDFGRPLYCLHPSILRHRSPGTAPLIIAKGVVVVTKSEKAQYSHHVSDGDDTFNDSMAPSATLDTLSGSQISLDSYPQDLPIQNEHAENTQLLKNNSSDSISELRLRGQDERWVTEEPAREERSFPLESDDQNLPAAMNLSEPGKSLLEGSRSDHVEDSQPSGKTREADLHTTYPKSHHTENRRADAAPHLRERSEQSPRGSRDTAGQKPRRRKSASDSARAASAPTQKDISTKSRGIMSKIINPRG